MDVILFLLHRCPQSLQMQWHYMKFRAKDLKNRNNPQSKSKEKNPTSQSAYEQSK